MINKNEEMLRELAEELGMTLDEFAEKHGLTKKELLDPRRSFEGFYMKDGTMTDEGLYGDDD